MIVNMTQIHYLEILELLGSGIVIDESVNGGLAVMPLPRYRRRTRDGRHEVSK